MLSLWRLALAAVGVRIFHFGGVASFISENTVQNAYLKVDIAQKLFTGIFFTQITPIRPFYFDFIVYFSTKR